MAKKFFLLVLAAALLAACTPAAGTKVQVRAGAIGCTTWATYAGEWRGCQKIESTYFGMVADHPEGDGHELGGRIRIQRIPDNTVLWILPGDVNTAITSLP